MNIGFIGIGKIASAVVEGLCTSNLQDAIIRLSPRNESNSSRLAARYPNVFRMESNQQVIDESDIVIVALRPTHAEEALAGLTFRKDLHIISLIPLLDHKTITRLTAPAGSVSRAIPLPPVVNHNCPIPIFNPDPLTVELLSKIGQPLLVSDEIQLHAIWTLTCLITPFYDLLEGLSAWTVDHGVDAAIANQYLANLFQSLSYTAQIADPIDFSDLAKHAATPGGMNEQAGKEIRSKGAHDAWRESAERILGRFPAHI